MRGIRLSRGLPPDTKASKRKHAELQAKLQKSRAKLEATCANQAHQTTGHGFIVFNYEADRNRFARKLLRTPSQLRRLRFQQWLDNHPRWPGVGSMRRLLRQLGPDVEPLPQMRSAGGTMLQVLSAPEPDEVVWENLELSDRYRAYASLITSLITAVMLICCCALFVLVRRAQVWQAPWASPRKLRARSNPEVTRKLRADYEPLHPARICSFGHSNRSPPLLASSAEQTSHRRLPRSGHVDGPPQQPRGGSRAERRRRPRRPRWLDGGGDLTGGCAGSQRSVDPSPDRPAKRVTHAHAAHRCAMWHSPRRRFSPESGGTLENTVLALVDESLCVLSPGRKRP